MAASKGALQAQIVFDEVCVPEADAPKLGADRPMVIFAGVGCATAAVCGESYCHGDCTAYRPIS